MKIDLPNGQNYWINDYLASNLEHLKTAVAANWDGVVLVDGMEGTAKTTLASACCHYLDRNYSLDSVVFTQEQFFEVVDKAKPGSAIHWDEFVFGGLSTEAMNRTQNALIKKMSVIRKKRLFIFLVMPWFTMMRWYFAVGRTRCLLHCYSDDGIHRGKFMFFSYRRKQPLYWSVKDTYSYKFIKADFIGNFQNTFGLFWDADEYDKKKEAAILSITEEDRPKKATDKKETKYRLYLAKMVYHLKNVTKMSFREMSSILGFKSLTQIREIYLIEKSIREGGIKDGSTKPATERNKTDDVSELQDTDS